MLLAAIGLLAVILILLIISLARGNKGGGVSVSDIDRLKGELGDSQSRLRQEMTETTQGTMRSLGELLSSNQLAAANQQNQKIEAMGKTTVDRLSDIRDGISHQLSQMNANNEERLKSFADNNRKDLENIRQTVEKSWNIFRPIITRNWMRCAKL